MERGNKDTKTLRNEKSFPDGHDQADAMRRVAFKMKLFSGNAQEYKKRHNEIWPELQSLLKESGVCEYSIFLDDETNILFGVMNIHHSGNLDDLPKSPVMRQWWAFMADIMETNEDHSPRSTPLKEMFYLP